MRYRFKHKPYEHQLDALKESWDKEEWALFLDMGTGKTKILIDNTAMLYDKGEINAALYVAPKGVYRNWSSKEIPEHMPEHVMHDVIVWNPSTTKKNLANLERLFEDDENLKILVMNVEAFSTDKGFLFAQRFVNRRRVLMAIDESTTIKNRKAQRTKSVVKCGAGAKYRRIATGSPITKNPMDLYSQCEFLSCDLLGFQSFWSFQSRYARMIRRTMGAHSFNQIVGFQNLEELTTALRTFSTRVRKEDCLDLPEKVYTRRTVELTPEQKTAYAQMKQMALALFEQGIVSTQNALTQILRLQQICSGAVRLDDGTVQELPTNKLTELMQCLEEVDGKVIIWANFTNDIQRIAHALAEVYGVESVATYYGETGDDVRPQVVSSFQDPSSPLRFFVGQPRTGGYGLTLTEAKTVVYYSNGYDLEIRLQSEDRAHRIGQRNTVTYIDIIAEGTIDEKILAALRGKIDIATLVLGEDYKTWII